MTLPAGAYTTAELAAYLSRVLGTVADALNWTVAAGDYDDVIDDALLLCGFSSLEAAPATDVVAFKQLRAASRLCLWRSAVGATSGLHQFSLDQQSFNEGQVHDHCVTMLGVAEAEAAAEGVGPGGSVGITPLSHLYDPYDVTKRDALWAQAYSP